MTSPPPSRTPGEPPGATRNGLPAQAVPPLVPGREGRPLGIGILGCADIARRRFLPALARCRGVRLVAVASRDPARAAALAAPLGAAATDYLGLLRAPDVDLVYVALPGDLHEPWSVAALEHGKHVLCEKPLALSAASVERMLAAAARHGRRLLENLMFLRHPQHLEARAILAAGHPGAPSRLRCTFHIPSPAPGDHRLDPSRGGGALHDLGRYPLGAAWHLLGGEVMEVARCEVERQAGIITAVRAEAVTAGGGALSLSIAFGRPYECWYELGTAAGALRLDRAFTPPADHRCRAELRGPGGVEARWMPAHDQWVGAIEHAAGLAGSGLGAAEEDARSCALARGADRLMAAAGAPA